MADLCFEEQSNVRSSFTWKTNKQTNKQQNWFWNDENPEIDLNIKILKCCYFFF